MSKVLVIDDNQLVSSMLREHLLQEGYEVAVAADANTGYSTAIEFGPDLILLDVQLPDVVGFDLIPVIKNRHDLKNIPIIMITGTAIQTEQKVKGFKLGIDDYVIKPFEMPELLERIKAILRRQNNSPIHVETAPAAAFETPTIAHKIAQNQLNLTIKEAVMLALLDPTRYPENTPTPHISMACIGMSFVLLLVGLGFTAGDVLRPTVVGLTAGAMWLCLIAALVMSTSLFGIPLGWKEGARLLSLALLPALLKLLGGIVVATGTGFSPLYFSSSAGLFMTTPPFWLQRLDIFELWAAALLWLLLKKRTRTSGKTSFFVTLIVWLVSIGGLAAASRLGSGG